MRLTIRLIPSSRWHVIGCPDCYEILQQHRSKVKPRQCSQCAMATKCSRCGFEKLLRAVEADSD